ncbi:unnamed protein product [Ranitomeya imitator]|uniref:Uncharacterized protein n=1 Tax=Ranitomeya imitator TaxID=111125 RepID=A0ABN9LTX0_9NEOB|nr:unnamed protein product [Ranitomeya imitator]
MRTLPAKAHNLQGMGENTVVDGDTTYGALLECAAILNGAHRLYISTQVHVQYSLVLKVHDQYSLVLKVHDQYSLVLKVHDQYSLVLKVHDQYSLVLKVHDQYSLVLKVHDQYSLVLKVHDQYSLVLKVHDQYSLVLKVHDQYSLVLKVHVQYSLVLKVHVQYSLVLKVHDQYSLVLKVHDQYSLVLKVHDQYSLVLKVHDQYSLVLKVHDQYSLVLKVHDQYSLVLKVHDQYSLVLKVHDQYSLVLKVHDQYSLVLKVHDQYSLLLKVHDQYSLLLKVHDQYSLLLKVHDQYSLLLKVHDQYSLLLKVHDQYSLLLKVHDQYSLLLKIRTVVLQQVHCLLVGLPIRIQLDNATAVPYVSHLAELLNALPTSESRVRVAIRRLCETWWEKGLEGKEEFGKTAIVLLLAKSLDAKCVVADIARLWQLHSSLLSFDYTSAESSDVKDLLLQCFMAVNHIKREEGRRFLSFLFSLDVNFIKLIHGTIKNQLHCFPKAFLPVQWLLVTTNASLLLPIIVLGIRTVRLILQQVHCLLEGHPIRIKSDNATTVPYVNHLAVHKTEWVPHNLDEVSSPSRSVMNHIAEIYFRAWKKGSGDILTTIEHVCIQDLMHHGVHLPKNSPVCAKVRMVSANVFLFTAVLYSSTSVLYNYICASADCTKLLPLSHCITGSDELATSK